MTNICRSYIYDRSSVKDGKKKREIYFCKNLTPYV